MHIYILADEFLSHTPSVSYIKFQSHVLCSYLPAIYNHMVTAVATSSQRGILQ